MSAELRDPHVPGFPGLLGSALMVVHSIEWGRKYVYHPVWRYPEQPASYRKGAAHG